MLNRSCVILCPNCRRQSTILVPLIEEVVKTISCPQCGCDGLLLADFFTPIGGKMKDMDPQEVKDAIVDIFTSLGKRAAEAMIEMLPQNQNSQITDEETRKFKNSLHLLDDKRSFDSLFGTSET